MDEDKADELYRLFQSVDQAAKHKRVSGCSRQHTGLPTCQCLTWVFPLCP